MWLGAKALEPESAVSSRGPGPFAGAASPGGEGGILSADQAER